MVKNRRVRRQCNINIFHPKTDYTSCNISILLVEDCTVYKISRKTGAFKPENLFQNAIGVNTLISFQYALCTINCLEFIE